MADVKQLLTALKGLGTKATENSVAKTIASPFKQVASGVDDLRYLHNAKSNPNVWLSDAMKSGIFKRGLGDVASGTGKIAAPIALAGAGYGGYEAYKNQDAIKAALGDAYDATRDATVDAYNATKDAISSGIDQARYHLDSDYRAAVDAAAAEQARAAEQAAWDSSSTLDKLRSDPSRVASDAWGWAQDNPLLAGGIGAGALAAGAGALALRKKLKNTK